MEFRILGPLEVIEDERRIRLGGPRQKLVLAFLILDANHVVPTSRLIDQVWGDNPPDAARGALFAYVSRLRKLLGEGRVQARPPGYILLAQPDEIDSLRFDGLIAEARQMSADPQAASMLLTDALELWRGGALSDLVEFDALRPAIAQLEEQRLAAVEDRLACEIDLGRHREAVPLLESLTREHPLRERLWGQLMLAHYRSGRQGDALAAFHRARTTLVEDLGIDPSAELRRLHEQVLNQDAALDLRLAPLIAEAVPLPASALPNPSAADRRTVPLWLIGFVATIVLAVVAAGSWLNGRPPALPDADWQIGLDMPLSGAGVVQGMPVRNAVQLAVDHLNTAGGAGGQEIGLAVADDARDADMAAQNARAFIANRLTVAMVGGWGSSQSFAMLPLTNQAGLLQCSPASTHPGLTKPRAGALDLRSARPAAINFVRLAPADDIQGIALASFAYRDLGSSSALVIDDADVGRIVADSFEREFQALGGATARRALNSGDDPLTVLTALGEPFPPTLVFFGGATGTGAARLRLAMVDAGWAATPLLSWDFVYDGSGAVAGSYVARVGTSAAVGSYVAHASLPDHKASFAAAYRSRFGSDPDEYAAGGYACVEIIFQALWAVAARNPSIDDVRELVRASAVDTTHRYETVLGNVGFDANGDALQQFVTFYRVDTTAAGGAGDWVIFKKQDFGPAP